MSLFATPDALTFIWNSLPSCCSWKQAVWFIQTCVVVLGNWCSNENVYNLYLGNLKLLHMKSQMYLFIKKKQMYKQSHFSSDPKFVLCRGIYL